MQVQLITPEKTFFSAEATQIIAPGTLGEFGVLPGHEPFISTLKPGVISIDTIDGQTVKVAVTGGTAEVVPERCTILAESAQDITGITHAEVQALLASATAALQAAEGELPRAAAAQQLAMAEAIALSL